MYITLTVTYNIVVHHTTYPYQGCGARSRSQPTLGERQGTVHLKQSPVHYRANNHSHTFTPSHQNCRRKLQYPERTSRENPSRQHTNSNQEGPRGLDRFEPENILAVTVLHHHATSKVSLFSQSVLICYQLLDVSCLTEKD